MHSLRGFERIRSKALVVVDPIDVWWGEFVRETATEIRLKYL